MDARDRAGLQGRSVRWATPGQQRHNQGSVHDPWKFLAEIAAR